MNCYACCHKTVKATHAIHLYEWKPVCTFHKEEAVEEESDGVWVRTIENHLEVLKRGENNINPKAS